MSTKSREVIWGGRIVGAKMRAETARKAAKEAVRKADRAEAEAWSLRMEGYGGPALPSPTSQWWLGLTGGQVQPMQDACEPASRRHPSTTRHAALEAGGFEMQIMPQGSHRAAGARDQADRDAGDHRVQVGAPG